MADVDSVSAAHAGRGQRGNVGRLQSKQRNLTGARSARRGEDQSMVVGCR